jgi:signal transduction histidine kinase
MGASRQRRWVAGGHAPAGSLAEIGPQVDDEAPPAGEHRVEALKRRLLRLALDVHDGPMQNLTAVGFSLHGLRRRIQELVPPADAAEIDLRMTDITTELVEIEQELRALINALEDGAVETLPLVSAIEAEIQEFRRRSRTKAELVVDGNPQARTDSQRIALQRIARAALANVARHADAHRVTIRLRGTAESLALEIEDDGRGFDVQTPTGVGRLGLAGMQERAELLGGSFGVTSRPGGPTVVSVLLRSWGPLPEPEPTARSTRGPAVRLRSAH